MKRHWKKIIFVLGILFLSVAGYLVYLFQFKEYDVADEEVDEITKEEYKVELPDGSTIVLDKEGNVIEDEGESETADTEVADASETSDSSDASATGKSSGSESSSKQTASASGTAGASSDGSSSPGTNKNSSAGSSSNGGTDQASGNSSSTGGSKTGSADSAASGSNSSKTGSSESPKSGSSNGGSSADPGSNNVTVAQIKQKYEPTLADIEAQANARISGLIGRAKSEYSTKKANGESISYSYFYSKYTSAAAELESRTDSVFYAVIGAMKQELKANGLAASHADSFISEYENRKEQRKNDLMKQATGL